MIKFKGPCYFISPHLDDAALSAGGLISYLRAHNHSVVVINIFTCSHSGPLTLSARSLLRQCGYTDPNKFYTDRKVEDSRALEKLGIKVINLDYLDAPWRLKPRLSFFGSIIPEINHIYPTHRWHISAGRISRFDQPLLSSLSYRLSRLVPKNARVFCPLAVGSHVDHVITKQVCTGTFAHLAYWLDFPYSLKSSSPPAQFSFSSYSAAKNRLIRSYRSQIPMLFPDGLIPLVPEKYYYED